MVLCSGAVGWALPAFAFAVRRGLVTRVSDRGFFLPPQCQNLIAQHDSASAFARS